MATSLAEVVPDLTTDQTAKLTVGERMLLGAVLHELQERGVTLEGVREDVAPKPQTDDELWQAVYDLTHYRIPRKAVCIEHGHTAPFDTFADLFFERRNNILWIGNRGGGKLLDLRTRVPSPSGWTTMGELQDGDTIFDDCGRRTRVLRAHEVVEKPESYCVSFSDGTDVVAGADHLWETWSWRLRRCGNNKKRMVREANIVPTTRIRDTLYRKHGAPNELNHSIPVAGPLQCRVAELAIDPWLLGAWLGDGASDGKPLLHTNVDEAPFFVGQICRLGMAASIRSSKTQRSVYSRQVHFPGEGFSTYVRQLGGKRIPDIYLRASIEQRRALLQGLMDTDGHITKDGKAEITVKRPELRDGVMELLRTLGYKPTFVEKTVKPCASSNCAKYGKQDEYGPYYRIRFQPYADEPPVRMPHKVARLKPRPPMPQMSSRRQIVAVEPVESVPMRCLTVDSPSSLYLCGEGMVPTHNTTNSGFLHGAKSRWNPGYTTVISGAVQRQGERAYTEFKRFTRQLTTEIVDTLMSRTEWMNLSLNEVIGGTLKALNGPHPVFAQMDELELSTPEPFEEFKNMAQSTEDYHAQQLLTSTRKKAWGLVQGVVQEVNEAVRDGADPPWDVDIFCVFETMRGVPHCRMAPKEEREARLAELGEDPCKLCDCHKARKGSWNDDKQSPRTFDTVCQGRAFRADGFVFLDDVLKRFRQLSRAVWEAQQECLRPSQEGLVHQWVSDRHVLRTWLPDPVFGPLYRSWDWGGCYDADTDVLTARGWTKWPDVREDDLFASLDLVTHEVEFQRAEWMWIGKEYSGPMHHYQNRTVDLLVSTDHNMLVSPVNGGDWRIQRSDEVSPSSRVTRTSKGRGDADNRPIQIGDREIPIDVWAAFLGFWMAEGHTCLGKQGNGKRRLNGQVGVTNFDTEYLDEMTELLAPYFRVVRTRHGLQINDSALYQHLRPLGKAGTKHLPDYAKRWSPEMLRVYLEWHIRGDGNRSKHLTHGDRYTSQRHGRIYTGSERLADDLQEIAMYAGLAATVSVREPRTAWVRGHRARGKLRQYVVGITATQIQPRLYNKPHQPPVKTTVEDDGGKRLVYCAHLPKHHTLYVRRNGKAVWSGNTNPHAVLYHQLLKSPVLFNPEDPDDEAHARLFKEGSIITFDELYEEDGCGFYELAERVFARDEEWADFGYELEFEFDICDPAGAAAKQDVKRCARDLGLEEPRFKSLPCPRYESVRKHIEWGEDDKLYYVGPMCSGMDTEYTVYHWPDAKPGKNLKEDPMEEDDHAMDSVRYFIWYIWKQGNRAPTEHPGSQKRGKRRQHREDKPFGPPQTHPPPQEGPTGDQSPTGSSFGSKTVLTEDPTGETRVRELEAPAVWGGS